MNVSEKPVTKKSLYSWVYTRHIKLQVLLLGIICVTVATRVLPLEMQKRIINEAIGLKNLNLLFLYTGLYIGVVLLSGILKYIINLLQSYIGQQSLRTIRKELFNHIISLPLPFFRKTPAGTVINSVITELIPVGDFIGQAVSTPAVNILTFIAMAWFMFSLNPLLAGLSIIIYPVEVCILPWLQGKMNKVNRRRINSTQSISGVIGESIGGVHEIHANSSFQLEDRKFFQFLQGLYKNTFTLYAFKYGIKFVNNTFQSLGPFILFLVGGYMAIQGKFDIGSLVAFLSAYEKLYDPWKELMEYYQMYQDSVVRYGQIMGYYDEMPDYPALPVGRDPYHMDGAIDVRDLSYVVSGNIKLLDKITMSIKAGEHVALVGFSGSGKSTLALCVAQIFKYTSGSIHIGGRDLSELTKADIAFNLGMVAQHPFIFDGTLKQNLLYSCEAQRLQGKDCSGPGGMPDLDRIIQMVQQVGLFLDVLRFGLRAKLNPEEHSDLVAHLIQARRNFRDRFGAELAGDFEFFSSDSYLFYSSVARNLIFGSSFNPKYDYDRLHENEFFRSFLDQEGLSGPLVSLGGDIAARTVDLISTLGRGTELFEDAPISEHEFEEYAEISARLAKSGADSLSEPDRAKLLKLGLAFNPSVNNMGDVSLEFMRKVVDARAKFMQKAETEVPGEFNFYNQEEYIGSSSIQDNILFGRIKTDSAGAEDRVNQSIMQLLIEENVLEQVVEQGLEFDVGSHGDRLSGGQRQKVALARAFLKEPPILILDEATAALDNASQGRIQSFLERKWKGVSTVIAVVHRLDILKGYDRVAVLKAGKLIEMGGYEELLAKKGALYELVHGKSQFRRL